MKTPKSIQTAITLLISLLILGLAAEGICLLFKIPDYIFPPPSLVILSLLENLETYLIASTETLQSAFIGFGLSVVFGGGLALALSLNRILRNLFLPVSVFFQTVPVIAVAPLLVIWFGFGAPTVRASAFIVSFFPVLAGALAGLSQVPTAQTELFLMLKATRLQRLFKLEVPSAMPSFLTGAKVAAGLAVVGAIVGEFIAGGGLGSLIDSARTQQRTEMVFAAIFSSTLLGLCMLGFVELCSWLLKKCRTF